MVLLNVNPPSPPAVPQSGRSEDRFFACGSGRQLPPTRHSCSDVAMFAKGNARRLRKLEPEWRSVGWTVGRGGDAWVIAVGARQSADASQIDDF